VITAALGFSVGILAALGYFRFKQGGFEKMADQILHRAELEGQKLLSEAQLEIQKNTFEQREAFEKLKEQKMLKLSLREEKLDQQLAQIEKRVQDVEKKEKELMRCKLSVEEKEKEVCLKEKAYQKRIEETAELTPSLAKEILIQKYTDELKEEYAKLLLKKKEQIENEAEQKATQTICTAINRLSLSVVSDASVTCVALPNQEMKRRVIGREGRNIRALEEATGMNFVIDDTPNTVVISGFDPLRKEIAKIALKELIQDGRIHPSRIEEVVSYSEKRVQQQILQRGEEAANEVGAFTLHPELIRLIGLLHFHYGYGQNMLTHSLEVSHLLGIMADELHLDSARAKRIGLLHDIGKAISQDNTGSHALIGEQIALKYGESPEIANGIGCHHGETAPKTIEASLCSAANQISSGRPGARSEAIEHSLKRCAKLESLTHQFAGVEKAYAMHAGRELRVIIEPTILDDSGALLLARSIAHKIEKEMSYSGKIKITVIRETKAVEYAT